MSTQKYVFFRPHSKSLLAQNYAVAKALERELLREWRQFYNVTQESLGKHRRPVAGKGLVKDAELGEGSMTVENLLSYIHALERAATAVKKHPVSFGDTDALRLIMFFGGPDEMEARRQAIKSVHALAERLGGGGRS